LIIFANKDNIKLEFLKKIIITTLLISLSISPIFSQDIHFSQLFQSPLSLNPANGGNHAAEWRIADIYRTQWFTFKYPYHSHFLSLDKHLFLRKNKFNAGLCMANDVSGDAILQTSKLYFNFSWHPVVGINRINVGVQAGYVSKNYSFDKLTFPDQYDINSGYYDPIMPNPDAGTPVRLSYPDINAGVSWSINRGKVIPEIGFAFFHINQPGETFLGTQNKLKIRKSGYLKIKLPLSDQLSLSPSTYYTEINQASEIISGFNISQQIDIEKGSIKQISFGLFTRYGFQRNMDAIILTGELNYRKLGLGVSYDINASGLRKYTSYQGAIELSIIYYLFNKLEERFMIPCERY